VRSAPSVGRSLEPLERISQLVSDLITTRHELSSLKTTLQEVQEGFKALSQEHQEIRERLARIEAFRETDRSFIETEMERFKLALERAALKRGAADVPQLGEGSAD
jgi:regulator of replication initiation timing